MNPTQQLGPCNQSRNGDLAYNLVENPGNMFLSNHKGKLMTRRKEDLATFYSSEKKNYNLVLYSFHFILYLKRQPVSGLTKG